MGAAAAQGSECGRAGEVWAGHVRQGNLGVQKERRRGNRQAQQRRENHLRDRKEASPLAPPQRPKCREQSDELCQLLPTGTSGAERDGERRQIPDVFLKPRLTPLVNPSTGGITTGGSYSEVCGL